MRIIPCLAFGAVAVLLLLTPNMTRRNLLFGLAVPSDFRKSAIAKRSIAIFRSVIVLAFLLATIGTFMVSLAWLQQTSFAGALLIFIAAAVAFAREHRQLLPFAFEPVLPRRAELTRAPDRLPWFSWLAIIPLLGLILISLRSMNFNHEAILGIELCAWMAIMGVATWFGARRSRLRHLVLATLIACEFLVAVLFAGSAAHAFDNIPPWLFVLAPLIALLPLLIGMAHVVSKPADPMEPTPNECWKSGMLYYNPEDPSLFVEKRFGLGYTFNFANRWSWVLLLGLVMIVATAPLLV